MKLCWVVSLAGICLALNARGQYRVRHYTIRDGLAQGGAYYMLKDSRRYVWFMSQDGLTRFDGTRFVNYYSSKTDPGSGPTGDTGSGLAETPNGDLWFGTEQCLNQYVRATNRFVTAFSRTKANKPAPSLTHVIDADSSRVWYINEADGLLALDWRTGKSTLYTSEFRHNPPHDNEYIKHRPQTAEIWILLPDNGVVAYNYRTRRARSFFSNRADNQAGTSRSFSALLLDKDGTVWLADDGKDELVALDPVTRRAQTYSMPSTLGAGIISAIEADSKGSLWLATGGDGLYQFSKKQRAWVGHLRNDPYDPNSIASNAISELLIDPEGIMWVNTDPVGLDQLTPDPYAVRHYDVNPIRGPSLGSHNVWRLVEDRHNHVWVGLYMGGIDVFDPKTERIIRHYESTDKPGSLPANSIYALHVDHKGQIWVGAGSTLCRYDELTDTFIPVKLIRSDSVKGDHRIIEMREMDDGRFLVSTWGGLYRFNPATNRLDSLADGGVRLTRALHYDKQKRWLFAARRYRDLVCYEVRGDSLRLCYTALPTLSIQDISTDTDPQRLWVATANGLFLIRAVDGRVLKSWHEKDGLPHTVTYSALPDLSGLRWVSTNRGLAVVDPRSGHVRRVRSIEPTEFNFAAFLRTQSGEMYFGSTTGLFRFNPLRQTPRSHPLSVNLTGLFINDQPAPLDTNLVELSRLSLDPDQRTLTLQFGAIDYFSNGQNRYRYRLTGYDRNWVESGSVTTTRYANLPPGDYTFEVLAADSEGRWMTAPRRLRVSVTPPFWRTAWFAALAILVLGSLAYLGFRTYVKRRLRRQRREFQLQAKSQKEERERLARDLHDHIGPDLIALKLQLEAARLGKVDPVIDQTLSRAINQADRIVKDVRQVSHALMPVGLQDHGLVFNLNEFVDQLNSLNAKPEISFTHLLDDPLTESQQQSLLQIAKELINNAVKHAQASLVDVELYQESQTIYLVVSDNGRGYDLTTNGKQPTGIGLRNIRAVVRQLKGGLEVTTKPTGGMKHQVTIPVTRP